MSRYTGCFRTKETKIKMPRELLIPRELLNILKNGNHHILYNMVSSFVEQHIAEHEWFEGALSEMALREC